MVGTSRCSLGCSPFPDLRRLLPTPADSCRLLCSNLEPNVYSYTALLAMPRDLSEAGAAELLNQAGPSWHAPLLRLGGSASLLALGFRLPCRGRLQRGQPDAAHSVVVAMRARMHVLQILCLARAHLQGCAWPFAPSPGLFCAEACAMLC